jgi:hypothetical protein
MIVLPGWTWHRARPVAPSDTVNNVGGTNSAGSKLPSARYLVNRSASTVLAYIAMDPDDVVIVLPIAAGGALVLGERCTRVNATGTTASTGQAHETVLVTAVGLAFTNQPANDGIEILSNNAADTTQSITLYGTTQGTDTVVVETVALNGTTAVSSTKTDWGVLLGYTLSASCAGTVTVREASGNATISTITTGLLSKGVEAVPSTSSYPSTPLTVVASAATTKQIGVYGTSLAGVAQGDSQALTGATKVAMNSSFGTETLVLTGDVENTVTVTVSVSADLVGLY